MHDGLNLENCAHSRDPLVGCALEGVATVLSGVDDVSIVIHSPQGCAATVALGYDNQEVDFTKRKTACSRLFETDIIMGATDKLKALIRQSDATFGSKVLFVVGTCAADIIGEDIEGLCRAMQPAVSAQLVPVFAGGFRGNAYAGMDLALDALVRLMRAPVGGPIPRTVNLIAPPASLNPTWPADLAFVRAVLARMDVTVQCVLTHGTSMHELRHAAYAQVNLLLSHDVGHALARTMETRFGVPTALADLPLPVGLGNTARWLTALGELFDRADVAKDLIAAGENHVADILRRRGLMLIPRYRNCRVALSADATFGIGLLGMLFEELEMLPETILVRSGAPQARALMAAELARLGISPKLVWDVDGYGLKAALDRTRPQAVIGSAWEGYMAQELHVPLAFDLLTPTNRTAYLDRAYFGYEGMLHFLEIMANDFERAMRSKRIVGDA